MESNLVGYVRKSNGGGALKLDVDKKAFDKAQTFESKDGRKFVGLVINLNKVNEIIAGNREVTSLCQIVDES